MSQTSVTKEFDYIIVGAGSAGCVLANRLSTNPNNRVLLLEAGGADRHPFIHIPAGLAKLVKNRRINWSYSTQPEPELNQRRLYWPRGRVLGGSSSINAMCYCRGHRKDYDHWQALGNPGWSYSDVLAYFKRAEAFEHGRDDYHGDSGPLSVERIRHTNPLSEVFLEAAEQAGFPRTHDFNDAHQRGFGYYHVTQKDGRRCSTAVAYLSPARARSNLTIMTGAMAQQVLFDGETAIGVQYRRNKHDQQAFAGQIILSGGAINSPQLLMLSGVGPGAHLHQCGLQTVLDLPGVGQNLQDHLDICTLVSTEQPITYDRLDKPLSALGSGIRYLLKRSGPLTSNLAEAGGFVVSQHASDDRPDIQMHFVPALLDDHGRNRLPGYGMTIHACPLRPESRGTIKLDINNPNGQPAIQANYLDTEYDRKMMLECVKLGRSIFQQNAFQPFIKEELLPGKEQLDDKQLMAFIRAKAETIYHPVGTCKMGADKQAVVDADLRVHGLRNLRVVDASIMPSLVSGNTNAPTIMIAERAADQILNA